MTDNTVTFRYILIIQQCANNQLHLVNEYFLKTLKRNSLNLLLIFTFFHQSDCAIIT